MMAAHDPMLAATAAALEVTFDGHHYRFHQFRYDAAADALRYARLQHDMPGFRPDPAFCPQWLPAWQPDMAQRMQMHVLGISLQDGRFSFGPYRYDRLEDAAAFATQMRIRAGPAAETG